MPTALPVVSKRINLRNYRGCRPRSRAVLVADPETVILEVVHDVTFDVFYNVSIMIQKSKLSISVHEA